MATHRSGTSLNIGLHPGLTGTLKPVLNPGLNLFPGLRVPWAVRRNPNRVEHERIARELAIRLKLLNGDPADRDVRRFDAFVAADSYSYPYPDLERLNAAGEFNQWLYFLDDQYDDHPEVGRDVATVTALMERSLGVLGGASPPAPDAPFEQLTAHLGAALRALAPRGWFPRFFEHVGEYLFRGSLAAMGRWSRDEVPTVDDYLTLRLYDSALFAVFDVVEIAAAVEWPDDVRRHPLVDELRLRAARHVAFANDVFSYQKEVLEHGCTCNLLHVLMVNHRLDLRHALREAFDLINGDLDRFIAAEAALPSWGPEIDRRVARYVDGLKAWIRGNVDFSLGSARFRTPDSPFAELRDERPATYSSSGAR